MAGRYAKHVSSSLKETLDGLSNEHRDVRADIANEIDLQRSITVRVLKLYDKVVVQGITNDSGDEASVQQKAAVSKAMADALETTTKLVERMVNIEAKIKDGKIDVNAIDFIALQLGTILEKHIQDEDLRATILLEVDEIMIPKDGCDPRVILRPGD